VERRFVIFVISLALVWSGFFALQIIFSPQQPPKPPADQDAQVAQVDDAARPAAIDDPAASPADPRSPIPAPEDPAQPIVRPAPPALPATPRQRLTLGSADPASGYSGLYYFDNHGAALECVELNGKKYASVAHYNGYLGRLAVSDAPGGGALVNVVGPGTPAALAKASGNIPPGLAVGDIIKSIDGVAVVDALTIDTYLLEKTRPQKACTLEVVRPAATQPITFTAVLGQTPLALVQPESHEYKLPGGKLKFLPQDPLSLLLSLERVGTAAIRPGSDDIAGLPRLHEVNWTVEQQTPDVIEFSYTLDEAALAAAKVQQAGPLKIVKRYTLPKAEAAGPTQYHVDLQVTIHNQGPQDLPLAYRLTGPTGMTLEGWWYSTKLSPEMWAAAGARDVVGQQAGLRHRSFIGCPKIVSDTRQAIADKAKNKKDTSDVKLSLLTGDKDAAFNYAGVDTQFFAGVILPQGGAGDQPIRYRAVTAIPVQDVTPIPKTRIRTANVSVRLSTSATTIAAGGQLNHNYQVFFGPKHPDILARYELSPLLEYGWSIFAQPAILLRHVLNGLYGITSLFGLPNYGIAIILLTVIVRTCMIPISLKQARSAAKMQELAPEIQKIKDKFPDDPMKQHAAVQELYKKHDFNMFGGCLPVFIQLPVFIGLYRCLSVDIDLRNAALIPGIDWASDLAGPDKLFRWDSWMPAFIADEADGWLGPFFNVFPLITVALFLVQQKMFTPPATDDQTRMQQTMMTYMTVFMGVMFYKVPAGLCIYFITSSLWGIAERKLLPKPQPKKDGDSGGGSIAKLPAKPTSPNGSARPSTKRPKQRR
jgi:YidC/Oxa1 family membrane protein insertase